MSGSRRFRMQWKNYLYEKTEGGVRIIRYLPGEQGQEPEVGEDECLCIPPEIDGLPVVEIGQEAFSENGALLSMIEVPPSVRRIHDGAFKMCMSLTDLVLHDGLRQIGEEALYLTAVSELVLPASVSEIDSPWELGNISWRIDEKNPYFYFDGYGLYRRISPCDEKTGGIMPGELLVVSQTEERQEYEVLAGTAIIGENAFAGNGFLEKVILPPTVHTIAAAAFENCQNLSSIDLPDGVKEIGAEAFNHCIRLKQIHLPSTLEQLGRNALSDTFGWSDSLVGLENITTAPDSPVFQAEQDALYENRGDRRYLVKYFGKDKEFRIPDDVTHILPGAFRRSKLHRVYIPKSVKDVAQDAFRECRMLEEMVLEEADAAVYVPGQPVYRKEEITSLFYSKEREMAKKKQDIAGPRFDELPEKWKAFAGTAIYSQKEDVRYQPYEHYLFDYQGYDAQFHTWLNLTDQCAMACCRLKYPVLLSEEVRRKYADYLEENLTAILENLAGLQDMQRLADLTELGFIHAGNAEDCIEIFNQARRTAMVSYLLNYKQEHFAREEFDFAL